MAKRGSSAAQRSGLYHARAARGMSCTERVKKSGVSKQQLSRLESGQIRLRLDHLKPFAPHLGYTPEQILLWGRFPISGEYPKNATDASPQQAGSAQSRGPNSEAIAEIDPRAEGRATRRGHRVKQGRRAD